MLTRPRLGTNSETPSQGNVREWGARTHICVMELAVLFAWTAKAYFE